ncbi:hypothetical protein ACDW_04430 [Acidovorax sp. DW039]|uniref:hypothetical protein n=1 Tax=Acidovorax sp. DW039 TaxID=3095606 RepID=UPI0030858AE1|nr:hypothetical protein ACDW_04430 [Acidovorax sp. DW039]
MFIVWGRKLVHRKLGHVADFCPICRKPRPFVLQRIGSAGHVYYISVGEGALVGFERTCLKCNTTFNAEPTHYAKVAPKLLPWNDLVRQTFPTLHEAWADRLALEQQVLSNPHSLSAQDRHALIRSPFLLLSPKVEQRFASTHLDKEVVFALIGAIVLLMTVPPVAGKFMSDAPERGLLVALLAGGALVGWQIYQSSRRFMRRQILPVLARSLMPLKPTPGELQAVVSELKSLRHKMGSKLHLPDLYAQMKQRKTAA